VSNHILALDIETTGLDFKTGSIIEIGAIHYEGTEELSRFELKFTAKPEATLNLAALRANKRNISTVQLDSGSYVLGLRSFTKWLLEQVLPKAGNKRLSILGHNVAFDAVWLKHALEEIGIVGWNEIFVHRVKDTAVIGEFLREAKIISMDIMSLENLATALGISAEKDKLHTAFYDTLLASKCYFAMLELMRINRGKDK